jgi:hypothetical protein
MEQKIFIIELLFRRNCTIGLSNWHKLQIAQYGIKVNLKIHMVSLIYKSLHRVKFYKNFDRFR